MPAGSVSCGCCGLRRSKEHTVPHQHLPAGTAMQSSVDFQFAVARKIYFARTEQKPEHPAALRCCSAERCMRQHQVISLLHHEK